jgi:hypothetical protein
MTAFYRRQRAAAAPIRWIVAILADLFLKVEEALDRIQARRKGTKIAILGPPVSGKTVVHKFLSTRALVTEYSPTIGLEKHQQTRIEFEPDDPLGPQTAISLRLAPRIDVQGDFSRTPDNWRLALSDAFLVLFMFDVSKFIAADAEGIKYRRLVVNGCDFAGGEIGHEDTKIVLVGTHCDLVPGWDLSAQGTTVVSRLLYKLGEIDEALDSIAAKVKAPASLVFGSLKDQVSAEHLLYAVFDPRS